MKEFPVRFPFVAQDTFNYLAGKYGGNSNLSCVMQLNGKVNEEILNQAVRLSLDEEPILGCHLIEEDTLLGNNTKILMR
jgi:NRPS condensation-like uncharacterized protein